MSFSENGGQDGGEGASGKSLQSEDGVGVSCLSSGKSEVKKVKWFSGLLGKRASFNQK